MLHIKDSANEMKRHDGWRSASVVSVMSNASSQSIYSTCRRCGKIRLLEGAS